MPLESGRRNYAMSVDSQDRTLSAAQEQTFLAARIEDLYMSYERSGRTEIRTSWHAFVRSPKSGHRMAAGEYSYSWGRHAGTISMDLKVIRGMSGNSLFQE